MQEIVILLLLFALPFIVGPFGTSFFETPKIYAGQFLIELLILYSIFKLDWKKINLTYFDYLLLGIFALTLIHFTTQPFSNLMFYGNQFRHQGVFLLWHFIVLAFLVSKIFTPNVALAKWGRISLISLLLSSFFLGTSLDGRAVGVFGEPNSLGAYATFVWPLTGSIWFAPIALVVILLSGSRAAFIAFCIQCAFLLFTKKLHLPTRIATVLCSLFIVLSLLLPFLDQEADYQNRALIWQTAFTAGTKYPILGWGFGNTEIALKETALQMENNLRYEYVDSSHNLLLDWWVQGGIVGVTLIISVIGITLKNFGRQSISSFLGVLTCLLFNPVSSAILVPFWILLGLANTSKNK